MNIQIFQPTSSQAEPSRQAERVAKIRQWCTNHPVYTTVICVVSAAAVGFLGLQMLASCKVPKTGDLLSMDLSDSKGRRDAAQFSNTPPIFSEPQISNHFVKTLQTSQNVSANGQLQAPLSADRVVLLLPSSVPEPSSSPRPTFTNPASSTHTFERLDIQKGSSAVDKASQKPQDASSVTRSRQPPTERSGIVSSRSSTTKATHTTFDSVESLPPSHEYPSFSYEPGRFDTYMSLVLSVNTFMTNYLGYVASLAVTIHEALPFLHAIFRNRVVDQHDSNGVVFLNHVDPTRGPLVPNGRANQIPRVLIDRMMALIRPEVERQFINEFVGHLVDLPAPGPPTFGVPPRFCALEEMLTGDDAFQIPENWLVVVNDRNYHLGNLLLNMISQVAALDPFSRNPFSEDQLRYFADLIGIGEEFLNIWALSTTDGLGAPTHVDPDTQATLRTDYRFYQLYRLLSQANNQQSRDMLAFLATKPDVWRPNTWAAQFRM